jgi:NtrC-family two-component system sensor histidine kinase KinB
MEERQRSPKPQPHGPRVARAAEPRLAMGTVETTPACADGLREDEVAKIVHDLRDPLATIALEAYLLDRKLAQGDHTDARSAVARILRNIEFLDRMVQDLLDSCASGDARLELQRAPRELRELVVDRTVSTTDRGRVLLEAPFPVTLSGDRLRIERVIANLIGNALKHTPKHGMIIVRLDPGPEVARVSVIDGGPGIPAEELESIFDKYCRGSTACGLDGRGLGLYLSKKIVEAHGGRIGVESVPGRGARFYFELPMAPT